MDRYKDNLEDEVREKISKLRQQGWDNTLDK
jgi:hypothetical protein